MKRASQQDREVSALALPYRFTASRRVLASEEIKHYDYPFPATLQQFRTNILEPFDSLVHSLSVPPYWSLSVAAVSRRYDGDAAEHLRSDTSSTKASYSGAQHKREPKILSNVHHQ